MNIFSIFQDKIREAVSNAFSDGTVVLPINAIVVEPPRDAAHGDLASNAAMVLAKPLKQKPRDIAELLKSKLEEDPAIHSVEIAGPGFLNIRLHRELWSDVLSSLLEAPVSFGKSQIGDQQKVNVEYVSANPTGPLHVGHCRGAVYGDALANLMDYAGYNVTKEYYINDAGGQIDQLVASVFWRYREKLSLVSGDVPEDLYPGDYLVRVAQTLVDDHGEALVEMVDAERNAVIRKATLSAMMDLIRDDLLLLNIRHDLFFSEQTLHDGGDNSEIAQMLSELRARDLVFEGRLPPPKGKLPDDWEDREQTLFRASNFGDDTDRALKKSNGEFTYFAADVAYMRSKYQRDFKVMIFVLGADHGGYVKRLQAVGKAIAGEECEVTARLCQLVKLFRGGEPLRMSKRAGNFITVRDLVEEVGPDPVRFMMLFRKNDAPLDFDYEKVTEQSSDNPVFYVQYAHARCHSVFRRVADEVPDLDCNVEKLKSADLTLLTDEGEVALIRELAAFPRVVEAAAKAQEPHRISFYLHGLASAFHTHWNKGAASPQLRFINVDTPKMTLARLALTYALAQVLRSGLDILGVNAPEEMH